MIFNQRVVQLTGARIALSPPSNFAASPGNQQVSLTWEDPADETYGGQVVATWEFTQIVRKVGSPPVNQTDGTVVTVSTVKNQYMSTPFVDTGLTNGTTYYYGAFACSAAGAWSDGAFAGAIPVAGTALGSFAEGTLVKIKENGTSVEFYVAKQGYEPTLNGPNRTLMVRKDVYANQVWDAGNVNAYATSDIDTWFNGTYKNALSSAVQTMIGTTQFYYTPGNGNNTVGTLERAVFALSATELGQSASWFNVEGSALPIANTLKIAYLNGSPNVQWTRSPHTTYTDSAVCLNTNGGLGNNGICNYTFGSRPCFTLPKNALVDPDMNLIESSDLPPIETPLGDLVEGTLITVKENGAPVEFYVAKQNYEQGLNGTGRVLCVRKDVQSNQVWNSTGSNIYANGNIDSWLNGTYKSTLSSNVQQMIQTTKFYYSVGGVNGGVSTLERSIFILSSTELNQRNTSASNVEGQVLSIANVLAVANYNGSPTEQWTRSPNTSNNLLVWMISSGGYYSNQNANAAEGARPCFTLPSTALVDGNLALIEEV